VDVLYHSKYHIREHGFIGFMHGIIESHIFKLQHWIYTCNNGCILGAIYI